MSDLGTITAAATETGASHTIRFERLLQFSPDEVWSALTEPARLTEWLASATVTPGLGGEVALDFGEGGSETGLITAWDPPRVLAYEWNFVGESATHVRWELDGADDGRSTRLVLEHTHLQADVSVGYGAGWHAHLEQLAGHLAGDMPQWEVLFEELRPRYEALIATTA